MLKGKNGLLWYKERVSLHSPAYCDMSSKPHRIMAITANMYVVWCQLLNAINSPSNLAKNPIIIPFSETRKLRHEEGKQMISLRSHS